MKSSSLLRYGLFFVFIIVAVSFVQYEHFPKPHHTLRNAMYEELSGDSVYICTSSNSHAYHKKDCHNLRQCKSDVEKISKTEAIKRGRKPCGTCY